MMKVVIFKILLKSIIQDKKVKIQVFKKKVKNKNFLIKYCKCFKFRNA